MLWGMYLGREYRRVSFELYMGDDYKGIDKHGLSHESHHINVYYIEQRQFYRSIQWDRFWVRCDDLVSMGSFRNTLPTPFYETLLMSCYHVIFIWICYCSHRMRASLCMVWVMDRLKELQIWLKIQFLISDDWRRQALAWLALHFELAALWKVHQLRAMLAHVLAKISVLGDQCSVIGELQWDLSCFFVSPRLGIIK